MSSNRNSSAITPKPQPIDNFDSLDVKASKTKISSNKNKSIEDDAWNLLNN